MRYRIVCAWLAGLLLAGCVPTSEQPISDPAAAKADDRLRGVWMMLPGKDRQQAPVYLHAVPIDDKEMDIVWVEHGKKAIETTHYRVFVSKVGKRAYMNAREWDWSDKVDLFSKYLFIKYEIPKKGVLSIWLLGHGDFLSQAVKSGKLKGEVVEGQFGPSIKITDTSENIEAFLRTADDKKLYFGDPIVFRKIREQPVFRK